MDIFILAQGIGFIALAFGTSAFQFKDQKAMFLMNEFANFIWIIHYLLLGGYTASFVLFISIIRACVVLLLHEKWKMPAIVIGLGCNLFFCLLSPELYWYKYLPFVAALIYSFALYFNDRFYTARLCAFAAVISWLVYGLLLPSLPEVLESILLLTSIAVGIVRHRQKKAA
jgi:hypothetical protein